MAPATMPLYGTDNHHYMTSLMTQIAPKVDLSGIPAKYTYCIPLLQIIPQSS
jgi:hypothetical protein